MGIFKYINESTGETGTIEGEVIRFPKGNIRVTECSGKFQSIGIGAGSTLNLSQTAPFVNFDGPAPRLDFGPASNVIPSFWGRKRKT